MNKAIDFYYSPTPNGWKVSIMLEECGLPYNTILINLKKGEQFSSDFLKINPNKKIPAITDYDKNENPINVFESGAILLYLAEKTGKFIPDSIDERRKLTQWLFWQVGNLGPMGGQHSHFWNYAPTSEKQSYAADRYADEYKKCLEVLEYQLTGRDYIINDYSIADIISWPWVLIAKSMGISLDPYPNVIKWRQRLKERDAVRRGVDLMRINNK